MHNDTDIASDQMNLSPLRTNGFCIDYTAPLEGKKNEHSVISPAGTHTRSTILATEVLGY